MTDKYTDEYDESADNKYDDTDSAYDIVDSADESEDDANNEDDATKDDKTKKRVVRHLTIVMTTMKNIVISAADLRALQANSYICREI